MIKGSGNDDGEPWNINSRDIMVVDEVEGCLSSECRLGRFGSEVSIMISRGHYVDNISSPRSPRSPVAASLDGRVSDLSDSEGMPTATAEGAALHQEDHDVTDTVTEPTATTEGAALHQEDHDVTEAL